MWKQISLSYFASFRYLYSRFTARQGEYLVFALRIPAGFHIGFFVNLLTWGITFAFLLLLAARKFQADNRVLNRLSLIRKYLRISHCWFVKSLSRELKLRLLPPRVKHFIPILAMKYFKLQWLFILVIFLCLSDVLAAPKRKAKPRFKLPKININIHHNSKL